MQKSVYKSYDELPLFLNSELVAKVLGVSPSSAYELMHEPGFPVLRVGNRMLVPKEQFIQWVAEHTEGGNCKCICFRISAIRNEAASHFQMISGSGN